MMTNDSSQITNSLIISVIIDDAATMATVVIGIVAISVNRYWSTAYPISYRKYVRQYFVYLIMTAVWCLSFSI
ncbi:unnamed protein product [Rotaria sp. Silwood2]|nr:unnamed protein product [Rotaria sp. Silwood2]CAF3306333.1 unnamed protein product [Rotaria sp. Silwood2]CAF4094781.1 unnamed protein product [Rotaria sp. Silwood2]CAF4225690.1 unnamed protein product [Rotaria sp. Silwood2]